MRSIFKTTKYKSNDVNVFFETYKQSMKACAEFSSLFEIEIDFELTYQAFIEFSVCYFPQ